MRRSTAGFLSIVHRFGGLSLICGVRLSKEQFCMRCYRVSKVDGAIRSRGLYNLRVTAARKNLQSFARC